MNTKQAIRILTATAAIVTSHPSAAVNSAAMNENTPLYQAAEEGNLEKVKSLVEHGESPNLTGGPQNYSLLELATLKGSVDIASFLIKHGANVNYKSQGDTFALGFAVGCGHLDIVDLLLKNGANIEAKTSEGWTPLIGCAVVPGDQIDIFNRLLKAGANIDTKDKWGDTVLHMAVGSNNIQIIKKIMELRPAMANIAASEGQTPLLMAQRSGHKDLIELLSKSK
jgi:ankyrin repeat protein